MHEGSDPKGDRLAHLEQALIDERSERASAQRRAADMSEATRLWRRRAEERSGRIARLEVERDQLRSLSGWIRARIGRTLDPQPGQVPVPRLPTDAGSTSIPSRCRFPSLSVAASVAPPLQSVVAETRWVEIVDGDLDQHDLVVLDPLVASEAQVDAVLAWAESEPRPPLVVVDDESGRWTAAELLLCGAGCTRDCSIEDHERLPDAVDLASVPSNPAPASLASELAMAEGHDTLVVDGSVVGVLAALDDGTSGAIASLAGRGFPVGLDIDVDDLDRAGARATRWAWMTRDPGRVLEQLLALTGVGYRRHDATVAGLLISNRPELIVSAIDQFLAQTHPFLELVVGCHGFDPADVTQHVAGHPRGDVVQIVAYDVDTNLGACLNDAVARTAAPVLAKIDDDDFYGSEFITDSLVGLRVSGRALTGKYSHYAYLENVDATVLRRPGFENTGTAGMAPGGSLVFERHVWEKVAFPDRPRKVDLHFVEGARHIGFSLYAGSRWNWIHVRGAAGHTWQTDDSVILDGSDPAWDGWQPDRCLA